MPSLNEYSDLMQGFCEFALNNIQPVSDAVSYYGTGEAAHWAVQSNFNVAGGLAVLGEYTDNRELIELALKLFRYNLECHKTGQRMAQGNHQWGGSWITVLGLERMVMGQLVLEKYLSAAELEAFKKLRLFEADFLLEGMEVVAAMDNASGKNKPESNYWNGSFLFRTAMDYPDCPNRERYLEKARLFLLNAISHPLDAASVTMYGGKELRDWHVGFNFTPNYSLDHHGYMNVGYSVVTLSQAAYLYFYCKERQWEFPAEGLLHLKDLWDVVKKMIFPDGRLLRIGGDTRARYCYCQMYLLPVLLMMEDLYGESESAVWEKGMLELLKTERKYNSDGSFFGSRLADMRYQSYYYYVRLESDPFAVLAMALAVRSKYDLPQDGNAALDEESSWSDDFHIADLIRNSETVRSMVRRAGEGPMALALPTDASDMAEWCGNGFTQIQNHAVLPISTAGFHKTIPGGFISSGSTEYEEKQCWGEGEGMFRNIVAVSKSACAALPDGKTLLVLGKVTACKAFNPISWRGIGWKVPNDQFNDEVRTYRGENIELKLNKLSGKGVIETGSRWINVDNKLTILLGYGADSLKIYAPAERLAVIKNSRAMSSLYIEEICSAVENDVTHFWKPGEILNDTAYAAIAGISADESSNYKLQKVETENPDLRVVEFTAADGRKWQFAANFGTESAVWQNRLLPAGECGLLNGK